MFSPRRILILASLAGVALTASLSAVGISTASAQPAKITGPSAASRHLTSPSATDPHHCVLTGSGNAFTCIVVTLIASGTEVGAINASAEIINTGRTIKTCLRGPQGTIGCNTFTLVHPKKGISFFWVPNSRITAGSYCANTYRRNADGSTTRIGHACLNVTA